MNEKKKQRSIKADESKKKLIESSYQNFIKAYNNNPNKKEVFTIAFFIHEIIPTYDPVIPIGSDKPLKSFRNCQPIWIENFLLFCRIFKIDPEEIVTDEKELKKIRLLPRYTPQTKTLRELEENRKRYQKFIGREREKEEIKNRLISTENNKITVIEGIGGAGKTSLVLESLLEFCEENDEYRENVIWLTAKPYELSGNRVVSLKPAKISFETILNEVAVKLGVGGEIESRPEIEQKKNFLRRKLGETKYLIIVDNIETVENFRRLVKKLEDFFVYSKVVITTRESVEVSNYNHTINIKGFQSARDSVKFIKQFLEGKPHAKELIGNNIRKLLEIHQCTGGLPLAMELIISQIQDGSTIDNVINKLRSIDCQSLFKKKTSDADIFNKFYYFIYEDSWEQLSEEDKDLLSDIVAEPLSTGLYLEDLEEEREDKIALDNSLKKLKRLNLIYYGKVVDKVSFFVHPLTYQFVKTK